MKTRDEILRDHRLTDHLAKLGVKLRGSGAQQTTTRCPTKEHRADHWCVSVNATEQIFHCNDCGCGGSIIDWLALEGNKTPSDVLKSLGGHAASNGGHSSGKSKPTYVCFYDYLNESHEVAYRVVRYKDPKTFRQCRPNGKGGWIWSMEGVTRILFNLPAVLLAPLVYIVEGEKDCQTLIALGLVATCNVSGAGKWISAYSDRLKGKDVVVIPDNDEAGRKHAVDVVASLEGKANSIKQVIVPNKDVTEFVESFPNQEKAKQELALLVEKTAHLVRPLPIYTVQEMEIQYREHAKKIQSECFDVGKFLPDFRKHIKPMVAGEVLLFLADTGVGKTACVQQLLRAAFPLQALLFELELPMNLLFERFVQMEIGCYSRDVQEEYREQVVPLWKKYKNLQHIAVCPESGLTTEQIESYIVRSELKLGKRPVVVAVDYVGLINGRGSRSRYEAVSQSAEELKVIAKRTGTIVITSSQIARPGKKESLEIGLHDAKDSGSLENSAGIVIGAWRPERERIFFKILKNTSGVAGEVIEAKFDGAKMQITPI